MNTIYESQLQKMLYGKLEDSASAVHLCASALGIHQIFVSKEDAS